MSRLIDADALPKLIVYQPSDEVKEIINAFTRAIAEAPTIDAESVKHGEWKIVKVPKGADFCFYQCSICGDARWQQEKYCGNCGAKMDKVKE